MFVHKETPVRTWKEELLTKKNPLFKIIDTKAHILGPHVIPSGQIVGDLLIMEEFHFNKYATTEQKEYYEYLKKTNIPQAYEYLLTITNSIDIWKQDIKIIEFVKELLRLEESTLKEEIKKIKQRFENKQIKSIPATIKKHIPEHIFDIDLNDIKSIEKLAKKEEILTNYLKEIHEKMPFLF